MRLTIWSAILLARSFGKAIIMNQRSKDIVLISSSTDAASENIAQSLQNSFTQVSNNPCIFYARSCCPEEKIWRNVWLWKQNRPLHQLNNAEVLISQHIENLISSEFFNRKTDITAIIFLSRHQSVSGKPSLTIHPVGIPWMVDSSDCGGIPGRCSPPYVGIASLFRLVSERSKRHLKLKEFEVTLEATHHGPHVNVPTCFVEIGSTEKEWSIPEAGDFWAQCLLEHLNVQKKTLPCNENFLICPESIGYSSPVKIRGVVLVLIGGGHYVPKMNDAARFGDGLYTGHALATYTLQSHLDGSIKNPVEGGWKSIIKEIIHSTTAAFPDLEIICLLDKKAFSGSHRKAIECYLHEQGVSWSHKLADIKAKWMQP